LHYFASSFLFLTRDGTTLSGLFIILGLVIVPCFVVSVIVEGAYLGSHAVADQSRLFWFTMIKAHVYSYLVLIGLDCAGSVLRFGEDGGHEPLRS
jgi:hypothetical protein